MYNPGALFFLFLLIFWVLVVVLIWVLIVVLNKVSKARGEVRLVNAEFSDKSRSTAGYLGIFLGSIGVHRIYLGYYGMGLLQIAVTVFTLVGGLWGMYEGMTILRGSEWRDSQGRLLRPSTK